MAFTPLGIRRTPLGTELTPLGMSFTRLRSRLLVLPLVHAARPRRSTDIETRSPLFDLTISRLSRVHVSSRQFRQKMSGTSAFGSYPTYVGLPRSPVVVPPPDLRTYPDARALQKPQDLPTYLPLGGVKLAHAALCAHERPGTCSSHRGWRTPLAGGGLRIPMACYYRNNRSVSACYGVARIQEP